MQIPVYGVSDSATILCKTYSADVHTIISTKNRNIYIVKLCFLANSHKFFFFKEIGGGGWNLKR